MGRDDDEVAEVAELRRQAAQAALDYLRGPGLDGAHHDVARAATLQYEGYLAAQEALEHARVAGPEDDGEVGEIGEDLRAVLRMASDTERALVLDARRGGRVSPASADEVLRDIEGRALRDYR